MKLLLLACLALISAAVGADEELDATFGKDVLLVVAGKHACYRFDVYLALTSTQRARGLMFVRDLPTTTGMLFVYDNDAYISMFMKNTYIPLDMVFVRADGTVASIARDTEPMSLRSIVATEPVRLVLELNAGTTERLGIDEASYLQWGPDDD